MFAGYPTHHLVNRLMAWLLVACCFACCCPGRSPSALFASEPARVAGGCCDGCHASGETDEPQREQPGHPPGRCLSDCCNKADFKAPAFKIACDEIGAPLPEPLAARDAIAARPAIETPPPDDDIGEPPPWRLLIVSARLRI